METIFKYRIETDGLVTIDMPKNAEILTVQVQHGNPFIWALVDDEAEKEKRVFEVYGTGHKIRPLEKMANRKYLGTYQLYGGNLVFHVFEIDYPF